MALPFHVEGIVHGDDFPSLSFKIQTSNASSSDASNFHTLPSIYMYAVAQAVCSINESISGGDATATLASLKSAPVGIRSITDNCAATYQEKLTEAKQQKAESGEKLSHRLLVFSTAKNKSD